MPRIDVPSTFIGWLYRPYFDFGEWEADGNSAVEGLSLAIRSLVEESDAYPRVHGISPPSVRRGIVRHAMLPEYLLDDPAELAPDLRTPAWRALCGQLADYAGLDRRARLRVLWALHRAGLHAAVLRHEHGPAPRSGTRLDDDTAALAFMRGQALYAQAIDGGPASAAVAELRGVRERARPGSWAHVEATYLLSSICVKMLDDVPGFRRHLERHARSVDASDAVGHERHKLLSRYHRIAALAPQLAGDHAAMSREMDRAEHFCALMRRDDSATRAEWGLLRYALLESRTKEMFVLGDFERAEQYALSLTEHMPAEPRALLTLGQVHVERENIPEAAKAYRKAALLGPQITHVAQFMLGQCLEHLGDMDAARLAYAQAAASDPLGISTLQLLDRDEVAGEESPLRRWADRRGAFLREERNAVHGARGYRAYEGKLGSAR
ncbi:tetratricopeptide repeat protein [Streptomyces yaizuensis]|uniref:Tetratricopeptide repeat protein n=1 Tax=Streptomyces yaizuensis TaxID=2989713 RepID=A0ABQ5NZI5_9ACTN|nr:tetratricopeptide repeat protein [Streptomyces sp. YSPA8]GLF95376.1 tetratricopeptide repeat protein [Streptomyces sp. YSPA8]